MDLRGLEYDDRSSRRIRDLIPTGSASAPATDRSSLRGLYEAVQPFDRPPELGVILGSYHKRISHIKHRSVVT